MKKLWLSPEEKIRLAMEMTEAVTAICAEGIRAQNPGMTEGEVAAELRRRIRRGDPNWAPSKAW